jgi:hypothetical protein
MDSSDKALADGHFVNIFHTKVNMQNQYMLSYPPNVVRLYSNRLYTLTVLIPTITLRRCVVPLMSWWKLGYESKPSQRALTDRGTVARPKPRWETQSSAHIASHTNSQKFFKRCWSPDKNKLLSEWPRFYQLCHMEYTSIGYTIFHIQEPVW